MEEIYLKHPMGIAIPGQGHTVHKLIKSLYGLKQDQKHGMKNLTLPLFLVAYMSMIMMHVCIQKLMSMIM